MHPLWLAIRLPRLPVEVLPPPATESARPGKAHAGRLEREALKALCAAAWQFSSTVTAQPRAPQDRLHTVWLEVGSSLRLFGGLEPLLRQAASSLARLGVGYRFGVAPTLEGASLLADAGLPPRHSPPELLAAVQGIPTALLPLPDEVLATFEGSGLARVGQVLDLPLDAMGMRFGYGVTDYLGRLTGRLPDPRRWYRLPRRYRRRFEFDGEVEALETLLFPLRRLLAEFREYLVARDTGVQEFRIELEHDQGPPSRLEVGMGSPSRDAAHFQVLARERFERTKLAGPVRAIALAADRFVSPRAHQLDFLNPRGSEDEEWGTLLDRLRARLGHDTVLGLGLAADHRPEKSWCVLPPGIATPQPPQPRRPLWLLPEPRPLAAMPRCVAGPERIEGGWWDGLDALRDYYVAEGGAGARLWVFRERGSGNWFLQGLWS